MVHFLKVLPGEHFVVAGKSDVLYRKLGRYEYKLVEGAGEENLNGTEMCRIVDPLKWMCNHLEYAEAK
jgi:hypothetical protein